MEAVCDGAAWDAGALSRQDAGARAGRGRRCFDPARRQHRDPGVQQHGRSQGVVEFAGLSGDHPVAREIRKDHCLCSPGNAVIVSDRWKDRNLKQLVIAIALAPIALLLAASAPVQAQNFPTRPITLIVPFPPGGSTDVAGRIVADKMGAFLGQPVIVENVGGAGGSIGVGRLSRATPDGYTIDIGQWDTHVGSIIYNLDYDLQTDFEPIGLISLNPQLLVATKALPADDLKALVAWMKAHPGGAKFVNQNAAAQVGGLLLQKLT